MMKPESAQILLHLPEDWISFALNEVAATRSVGCRLIHTTIQQLPQLSTSSHRVARITGWPGGTPAPRRRRLRRGKGRPTNEPNV
jgi:hypothetical protein